MKSLSLKHLFQELRRREVFKTAALYIVGAWVMLQVADLAFPGMDIPDSAIRYVWLAAILLFPLVLIFAWRYDLSIAGIRRTLPADAVDDDRALHGSDYGTIGGLSVIALGVLAVMAVQISRVEHEREFAAPANSIAVMPFEVCEGAPLDLMLARGLSDEVINRLAERGKLKVIARASAQAFAGFGLSVPEIAKPLGVEYVLKGEVCRDGTTPTLTAELSDQQGFIVWSGSFTQQVNEFEQITARLASQVADGVAAELGDVLVLGPDPPVNSRAYEQLIIGREHRIQQNREEAQAALEKALEIQPDYPEALLQMAQLQRTFEWSGLQGGEGLKEARAVAEKALVLARRELQSYPNSASAHHVAGNILSAMGVWDGKLLWRESGDVSRQETSDRKEAVRAMFAEAERHFRTAISLSPSRSEFYSDLAFALESKGPEHRAEALEVLERSLSRDPLNAILTLKVANRWALRGRYRQGIELLDGLKRLPEIPPATWRGKLGLAWKHEYNDEFFETLIDMLVHHPEAFTKTSGLHGYAWLSIDTFAYLGLLDHAEAWQARLKNLELSDAQRRWSRINYLTGTGQWEQLSQEMLEQMSGLSNEEVLNAFYQFGQTFAKALAMAGEHNRAIQLMESVQHARTVGMDRDMFPLTFMAEIYEAAGRHEDAARLSQEIADFLEAEYDAGIRHPSPLFLLASAYARLGRDNDALEMLRKAVDYNFRWITSIVGYPFSPWKHLNDDPRFVVQINRIQADLDQRAERVRAMLAEHDLDELLAPLMEQVPELEEKTEQ